MIRQGELVGRGLMAYETTEEMGLVVHTLVNMKRSQVVGLVYKSAGLIGRKLPLAWGQVVKIGQDRIVVRSEVAAEMSAGEVANEIASETANETANETTSKTASSMAAEAKENPLAAAQDVSNLEVWTDGGDHIGRVVDVCFDGASGAIAHYLFALNTPIIDPAKNAGEPTAALFGEEANEDVLPEAVVPEEAVAEPAQTITVYVILPDAVISAGRKRMMIAEEDAKRAKAYDQPLTVAAESRNQDNNANQWRPENLPKNLPEMMPDRLSDIPSELTGLMQKGQSLAGQMGDRIKQRAKQFTDEQLKEREFGEAGTLPDISEQLQDKSEQVKTQMQQQLQRAREKAQAQLENSGLDDRLEQTLGKLPFGQSLNQSLKKNLDKLKGDHSGPLSDPIDVESFEVWEDDD